MKPASIATLSAAVLGWGCVLEQGPPAEVDDRPPFRSIEEREQPGSLITLRAARPNVVRCIHCGAENPRERDRCEACDRPMAVAVYVPCPGCSVIADPALRAVCKVCAGRGFLEAGEEGGGGGTDPPRARPGP